MKQNCRAGMIAVAVIANCLQAVPGNAARDAYWWQDELRTVAFALSTARTGKVSHWPRLTVPAGSGTLPVPEAAEQVAVDGVLTDAAWERATVFPAGPLFGPWKEGPCTLWIRACRVGKTVYLALEADRDLTGLRSLAGPKALFSAGGKHYRVAADHTLLDGAVAADGRCAETAIVLPNPGAQITLTFYPELVRGGPPAGFAALGLTKIG